MRMMRFHAMCPFAASASMLNFQLAFWLCVCVMQKYTMVHNLSWDAIANIRCASHYILWE